MSQTDVPETDDRDGGPRRMPQTDVPETEGQDGGKERERERECLGWVGLGWVGLGWVGLGWVGLGWVGLVGVQEKGCGKCDIFWCNICMMVCLFLLLLLF